MAAEALMQRDLRPDAPVPYSYNVRDWRVNGNYVGSFMSATLLLKIPGLEVHDSTSLKNETIRLLAHDQTCTEREDVGG